MTGIVIALALLALFLFFNGKPLSAFGVLLVAFSIGIYSDKRSSKHKKPYTGGGGCPYCGGELYEIDKDNYSLKCKECRIEFP